MRQYPTATDSRQLWGLTQSRSQSLGFLRAHLFLDLFNKHENAWSASCPLTSSSFRRFSAQLTLLSVLKPSEPSLCVLNKLQSWLYLLLSFLLFPNRASLFLTPLKYHFLLNPYLFMSKWVLLQKINQRPESHTPKSRKYKGRTAEPVTADFISLS